MVAAPRKPRAKKTRSDDEAMACYLVNISARLLGQLITRRLAEFGINTGQLPTLLALYDEDGQTQVQLARRTGVEQPTMALTLRRMERDGLIERVADPKDGRKRSIHLTERSRSIETPLRAIRREIDDAALSVLSPADQRKLHSLLARFVDELKDMLVVASSSDRA